jgi:hypothetical protein
MAIRIVTGIREVDQKLDKLARSEANKIARKSVNAGLSSLAKSLRSAIANYSNISPEMKKALRKTVGKRFITGGRAARFGVAAKVGLGVGKGYSGTKERKRFGRRGVGISGNNVHWAARGTDERYTGSRTYRTKTGSQREKRKTRGPRRYRGAMPQIAVVKIAGRQGLSSVRAVMLEKALQAIEDSAK